MATQQAPQPSEIGHRVRMIRRRRGLSLDVAAGLAGISKPYLSQLETGKRRFERRGLLENLAGVLGCSVSDLTGQPYLPGDRASADALATLPAISVALYDATLDDVPDIPARPVHDLAQLATKANEYTANNLYSLAGRDLAPLLVELHVLSVSGDSDTRRKALVALVETCFVASAVARSLGNLDLAVSAARRAEDAASRTGDRALCAFAAMTSTSALSRLGARRRARQVAAAGLDHIENRADPGAPDTSAAESAGMLYLSSAQLAAKDQRPDEATSHLDAARELADRTGERNRLWFSFGPANVRAWSLAVAVELERGPQAAEDLERTPGHLDGLDTADRRAAFHFDLARAHAQAEGARDDIALRHLDTADRIAPQRIRHDPIARSLLETLENRARLKVWELGSLRHRFGMAPAKG